MTSNRHPLTRHAGLLTFLLLAGIASLAVGHPGATHSVKAKVRGTVESIEAGHWVVAGHTIVVTIQTDIEDYVRPGDYVRVEAEEDANGNWVAREIDRKRRPWRPKSSMKFRLEGSIEAMVGDTWTVAGKEFRVTPRTSIEDSVFVGARVKVDAYAAEGDKLIASEVDSKEERRGR